MAEARLLEARGVTRTYPGAAGVTAVRNVSMILKRRDFALVIGPSGSGKTTFLGMLAGFDRPDEGEVLWQDRSFADLAEARERASAWLERLDLGHRLDHRTFELSGGQQQRVAVARALVTEPDVVLADEPIAEVDTENADLILSALWEVVVRDGAVLAATHNPEALRYASRVVVFRDGSIEAEGSPDDVASRLTTD